MEITKLMLRQRIGIWVDKWFLQSKRQSPGKNGTISIKNTINKKSYLNIALSASIP